MALQIPIVSDELSNKTLQDDFMQTKLRHRQIQSTYAATSQLMPLEVQMDKTLLKLIHAAIKSDQLEKALELASVLNLQRSLQGALKVANALRKRLLAEKITLLIQNRQALLQVQKENPIDHHNPSQLSDIQSPFSNAKHTKMTTEMTTKDENVFSRKRAAASDMLSPKTPKTRNPFARNN